MTEYVVPGTDLDPVGALPDNDPANEAVARSVQAYTDHMRAAEQFSRDVVEQTAGMTDVERGKFNTQMDAWTEAEVDAT